MEEKNNISPTPETAPTPPTPAEAGATAPQVETPQPAEAPETKNDQQTPEAAPVTETMAKASAPVEQKYAGFWIRFVATVIDGIVLSIAFAPVFAVLSLLNIGSSGSMYSLDSVSGANAAFSLPNLIRTVLGWIYYVVLTVKFGGTLGKMALGLRVIDGAGNNITYSTAVLREIIGKIISAMIILLGYIWVAFDPKKQAWHDKIAKTYVIRK